MRHLFLFLFCLVLAGCATVRAVDERVDFNITAGATVYRDQWVQRNPPEVHVQPRSEAPQDLKVLFVPFRVTQPMDNPGILGYSTARTVWQTWLTMQLFPHIEFSGDDTPYRRDRAVALARSRGADLVVGGFVTYMYAGGTAGDTQIAIQLEAHDAFSGQMVWSMAQSGLMPASRTTDFFLFASKTRTPSDPMHAVIQALASDMGRQVQSWVAGPSVSSGMHRLDQDIKETVFGPTDPVPGPRGSHVYEPTPTQAEDPNKRLF